MAKHILKLKQTEKVKLGNSFNWRIEVFEDGKIHLYHKDELKFIKEGYKMNDIIVIFIENSKITIRKLVPPKNDVYKVFWAYGFNKSNRVSLEEIENRDEFWGIEPFFDRYGNPNDNKFCPSFEKSLFIYAPDNRRILAILRSGKSFWGDKWTQSYYVAPDIKPVELEIIKSELEKSEFEKVWYAEDLVE